MCAATAATIFALWADAVGLHAELMGIPKDGENTISSNGLADLPPFLCTGAEECGDSFQLDWKPPRAVVSIGFFKALHLQSAMFSFIVLCLTKFFKQCF